MRRRRRSTRPSPTGVGKAGRTSASKCRADVARYWRERAYSGAVATGAFDSAHVSSSLRSLIDRRSAGALVLAAAIPFLFLHERFQPELEITAGTASLEIRLADWAVLAVVLAASVSAIRLGVAPLRPGRLLWIPGALLLGWLAFAALRPASLDDEQFDTHFVSFLKFVEYALLAITVPLLVRRGRDLTIVLLGIGLWSAVATWRRHPPVLRKRHLRSEHRRLAIPVLPRAPRPRGAFDPHRQPRRSADRGRPPRDSVRSALRARRTPPACSDWCLPAPSPRQEASRSARSDCGSPPEDGSLRRGATGSPWHRSWRRSGSEWS